MSYEVKVTNLKYEDIDCMKCDNCGTELGETAVACRGYNYITCSSSCMAALMLNLHRVNTAKFLKEEITRADYKEE